MEGSKIEVANVELVVEINLKVEFEHLSDSQHDIMMVLEQLGTRAFLPALLAQLNSVSLHPIPLDPVIFQSILLVFAAGHRKHLILKATDPEEIGIIARTAEWVSLT